MDTHNVTCNVQIAGNSLDIARKFRPVGAHSAKGLGLGRNHIILLWPIDIRSFLRYEQVAPSIHHCRGDVLLSLPPRSTTAEGAFSSPCPLDPPLQRGRSPLPVLSIHHCRGGHSPLTAPVSHSAADPNWNLIKSRGDMSHRR